MTKDEFESLSEIAGEIELDENSTVEELVDAIIHIGNSDNVYARYDEHLGLVSEISSEFSKMKIVEVDDSDNLTEYQQEQYSRIVEVAKDVLALADEELSDDEIEELEENKRAWEKYAEKINED